MELEMATTEDIVNELMKRRIRFVFVGIEDTNSLRDNHACVAGKGVDSEDVENLFDMGQDAFQEFEEESDGDSFDSLD